MPVSTTTDPTGTTRRPPASDPSPEPSVENHTAKVVITDDPRVEPELGAVLLESEEYDKAAARYVETADRRDDAARTYERAIGEIRQLASARARLLADVTGAQRRKAKADSRLDQVKANLRSLAVNLYLQGGLGGVAGGSFDLAEVTELGRQRVFVDLVQGDQLHEERLYSRLSREQGTFLDTARHDLVEIDRRLASSIGTRDTAGAERDTLTAQLPALRQAVADQRLESNVVELDFRLVNFNAYFHAAKAMRILRPSCGIRWTAIAAISKTEGRHGTFGGAEVDANGNISKPIYGVPLDGSNGTANIGDTDDGEFDGAPDYDRAVGPMQFIPSTWKAFALDGNGDGKIDPQNVYDSAMAAAAYLCRQGPGLDTDEGLRRAFYSYNHDGGYVAVVLDRAHVYDLYEVPPIEPGRPSPSPAIHHAPPPAAPADPQSANATPTETATTSTPGGTDP